ncbi:MAG: nucleotidyltransferase domain-containing protein [Spirochaetota bacterium]
MRWPGAEEVDRAVRRWARSLAEERREIQSVGYFGSYATGLWGVGSDCDIVVILQRSEEPFEKRARFLRPESLPVPADVLVYTAEEWEKVKRTGFGKTVCSEMVWVFRRV